MDMTTINLGSESVAVYYTSEVDGGYERDNNGFLAVLRSRHFSGGSGYGFRQKKGGSKWLRLQTLKIIILSSEKT